LLPSSSGSSLSGLSLDPPEVDLIGAGTSDFVGKIASVVLQKILPAIEQRWQNYNLTSPAEITVTQEELEPPQRFGVKNIKDDLNDKFDENSILKLVPPRFRRQAETLLQQFDEHSQDITWSSDGTLYIDQVSIPESNFFVLFPALFKSTKADKILGYGELYQKLNDMGLVHLIRSPQRKIKTIKKVNLSTSTLPENWWFIG